MSVPKDTRNDPVQCLKDCNFQLIIPVHNLLSLQWRFVSIFCFYSFYLYMNFEYKQTTASEEITYN